MHDCSTCKVNVDDANCLPGRVASLSRDSPSSSWRRWTEPCSSEPPAEANEEGETYRENNEEGVCALLQGKRSASRGRKRQVQLWDVVDNSLSPLRMGFELGFSSVDAPKRVLHAVDAGTWSCFPLPQTASCSFTGRRLTSFRLT